MTPINPLDMLKSAIANGINPISLMRQHLGNDPRFPQAMQMINRPPAEQRQLAINMAKERGTTVEAVAQSLGIKLP